MADGDSDRERFEEKLRALARELGQSVERVAGGLDRDEIADRIAMGGERVSELADFAGRWIKEQLRDPDAVSSAPTEQAVPDAGDRRLGRPGPHPRDMPTEEQGLALSALDSGRWKVEPGTNELISEGDGPNPADSGGIVGELRARDWITADGAVTLLGRAALRRWEKTATPD